jgi:sugar/nucleoside kinase (ribokinase family)
MEINMSNYDVYGIGNALVDMEFEVENTFLTKSNIEKGLMTLVDGPRQADLLTKLGGERHRRGCGGSAANTVIAVSQFGGNSFYSCKVANDEAGDFYSHDLERNGVTSNLSEEREEGVTGKCMVFVTPDADRTMNTYLGITENFSYSEINEDELKKSKFLYIEGYLVTSATGKAAAIKTKKLAEANGIKTSLTLSDPGIVEFFKAGFLEILGDKKVDILFCNEDEALKFTGKENLKDAHEELLKYTKSYTVTKGKEGAILFDGEKEIDIITQNVDAVDTNGAGDLFAGAFLYSLTQGDDFASAGRLACKAASELVTHFGARLNTEQITNLKG